MPHSNNKIDWKNAFAEAQNWRCRRLITEWLIGSWSDLLIDFWLMNWPKKYPSHLGKWFKREDASGLKTGQETVGLTKRFALKQIKVCVDALSRRTLDLLEVSETDDMNHVHKITSVWMWTCEPCCTEHFCMDVNVWILFTVTSILIYQWTACLERDAIGDCNPFYFCVQLSSSWRKRSQILLLTGYFNHFSTKRGIAYDQPGLSKLSAAKILRKVRSAFLFYKTSTQI